VASSRRGRKRGKKRRNERGGGIGETRLHPNIYFVTALTVVVENLLTWKRSRAMAVMLIVDTNTLAPEHIGTNLHMNPPSRQFCVSTFSSVNGCVKRQRVRSEMARLMMKMFRGVLMAAFRATTKHTRLLPAAPNAINSANRVIRIFCKKQSTQCAAVLHVWSQRDRNASVLSLQLSTTLKHVAISYACTVGKNTFCPLTFHFSIYIFTPQNLTKP